MKARARKRSDSCRAESIRDTSTLPTPMTTRSVVRQVCIGDMEEELHRAFAMARVPGGTDFVYERDHDAYARLDEFCNWNQMSEPAAPLAVFGPSGSGKSALLANWLLHYRRRLDQRPKHGGLLEEPFVFCHAVGCTRHGVDVDQLLWRLLADLKQKFDLARNVPNEAERLSWELPRFLELAGRKGRVIIVIDGLHRLQDKNGGEAGLQWLPLHVPGNVRVIVTATNPDPNYLQLHEQKIQQHMMNPHQELGSQLSSASNAGGGASSGDDATGREQAAETGAGEAKYESSHRRRKVLMELQRRKWPTLEVGPLETWRKRDIVEAFLKRSLAGASDRSPPAVNGGRDVETQQGSLTFLTDVDLADGGTAGGLWSEITGVASDTGTNATVGGGFKIRRAPGLVLFPSMIESILSSDATNSALYLRTLLRVLDWAAVNAYDVRALLTKMLTIATSVGALYNVFFDSIESGNHPTGASTWATEQANKADGGVEALRKSIDAFSSVGSDYKNTGAEAGGHQRVEPPGITSSLPRTADRSGGRVANGQAGDGSRFENNGAAPSLGERDEVDSQKEVGKGNKEDGGEGDGDDEESYEEDEFDEDEGGDTENEGANQSDEGTSEVTHRNSDGQEEDNTGGGGNVSDQHNEHAEGAAIERTGDQQAGSAGGSGGSTHDAQNVTHSTRALGPCNVSEIPIYLCGGGEVEGFGVAVGRAVALLHVVRHGLRSQELWSLLAALKASKSAQEEAEGTEGEAESRLLRKLLKNQNRLIDSIRVMDADRDGVISTDEFRAAVVAMDVGLTERQVEKLIRSIDSDNDGELDMQEMIERFSTTARKMKRGGGGSSHRHSQSTGKGELESSTLFSTEETEEDMGEVSALSHGTRGSLKSALSVLGVNHDGVRHAGEEHNVFVLGLDAEDLREVVFRRYVASASTWHSRLVRFFQAQAPSPRRCEELPWHLNKCYRWHPLKNTLVDLRTFETMWTTTQLRRELMDYWKLLTEGPLHASEEAEAADQRHDSSSRLLSVMMQESCSRGEGGASVSAADIIAVGNKGGIPASGKVAPFDLVFEYNHAVEGWQAFSRPTISRLGEMVHTIGDFMREMSQLLQKEYPSPPFLHMPLDFKDLGRVGIGPELVALTGVDTAPGSTEAVVEESARNKDAVLSKPKGAPKDKLSHYRVAPFYYFQSATMRPDTVSVAHPSSCPPSRQRWLWVQFPWMALAGSGAGSMSVVAATTAAAGGSGGYTTRGSLGRGDTRRVQQDKSRRFWSVKRIDPFGDPSVHVSDDRLRSRLKAELGRSATTTLLDTRSHANLLGDVGAGMISTASSRRHTLRAEAQELFGTPLPNKPPRGVPATASTGSLPPATNRGSVGRGGFLSEDDSEWSLSQMAMPADLKTLGLGRDSLVGVDGGGALPGRGSTGGNPGGASHVGSGLGRRRKRGRDRKFRTGLADPRKTVSTLVGMNPLSPLPGKALVEVESFLASSTSIFPMSVDEEMVLEAKDMALKLRQIHDALEGEVKQKRKRLVGMKRDVEERNSQDAYTMSRTMAGEHMIKALDTRLAKVRSTTAELERVGSFYSRIIELCVNNPPKDNRHLRALEEQVFLSKQQTTDLSGKVQDLLFQKDAIERLGIDGLRAQLARTKAVRQKVNARTEQLREQIQKSIKSERRGLALESGTPQDGSLVARATPPASRDHPSMPAVGLVSLVATSSVGGTHRSEFEEDRMKGEGLEEALEQLAILVGSQEVDDIADKFKAVQAREQDLRNQGQSATHTVERRRRELEESRNILLHLQVVDTGGVESEAGASSSRKNANLHREQRRLDDLVFQSSIRLAQSARKAQKAKGEFNDLRVGVLHLAHLVDSVVRLDDDDGGLIPARSRVRRLQIRASTSTCPVAIAPVDREKRGDAAATYSTPTGSTNAGIVDAPEAEEPTESDRDDTVHPVGSGLAGAFSVDKEEDVCKLLAACEKRIRGVMKASGLDEARRIDTLPTASAAESANAAQQAFWHSGLNAAVVSCGNETATEGPDTPSVLHRLFMGRTKGLQGDGAGMDVRVLPPKARDNRFERSMGEALRHQNEVLEMQETEANNLDRNAVATGVASFLEDALNSKSANKHLRRANMLVMGKQGKRAGFGLVMDDVLSGADIDIYGLADATRRRANGLRKASNADGSVLSRNDLATVVRARPDLKASAQATSSRRKHEDRKKALLKKRVDQTGDAY